MINVQYFRIWQILIDILIIVAVYIVVFQFRFEWNIPSQHIHQFWQFLPVLPLIRIISNYFWGIYQHIWQYFSLRELISLIKAVLTGTVVFILIVYLTGNTGFPRSIFLFETTLILISLGGVRLIRRFSLETLKIKADNLQNTLIIGAGDAGESLVRDMLKHPQNGFLPVGFIDDDKSKKNAKIHGIKVYGGREIIEELVKNLNISVIVIAIPTAPPKVIRELVNICNKTNAKIHILPSIDQIIKGNVSVSYVREIKLEDLIGRTEIILKDNNISKFITNKNILVTGAGGSIGAELCRQLAFYNPQTLNLLGHGENSIYNISKELQYTYPNLKIKRIIADIRNNDLLKEIFAQIKPDIVFHTAAHKHVPLMEENVKECFTNNVVGTENLVNLADQFNVKIFVNISTDKAVKPVSVMGITKKLAELIVLNKSKFSTTKFTIVRFGNVIGSRGSVIPLFEEQIKKGGPITVTHPDMTRYFMTIPEAVHLVIQTTVLSKGGEIFILDMGEPIKILDIAKNIIKFNGYDENDIPIKYIGVRDGEKLAESLIEDDINIEKTENNKILFFKPQNINDTYPKIEYLKNNLYKISDLEFKNKLLEVVNNL